MRTRISANIFLLLLTSLALLKLLLLQHTAGLLNSTVYFMGANLVVLLLLFSPSALLKPRYGRPYGLLMMTAVSTIVFADLIFFRYFNNLVPIHALFLANQMSAVAESIRTIITPWDFLLFSDVFLLAFLFAKRYELVNDRQRVRRTALLLLAVTVVTVGYSEITTPVQTDRKQYLMARFGALPFHVYDIGSYFWEPRHDMSEFVAVYEERQLAYESAGRENFGLAAGRNLIMIQVEAMNGFILDAFYNGREITPFLNGLQRQDSYSFSSFYQMLGLGVTSDAEFVSLNSFYPSTRRASYHRYQSNRFNSLPVILREAGYSTQAFHGFIPSFWNRESIYPKLGFEQFISLDEFVHDEIIGMGLSDASLYRQALPYLVEAPKPCFGFFVTLTSHHPWLVPEEYRAMFPIEARHENMYGQYLQSMHYVDLTIAQLFIDLQQAGLYDDSIIVIYGDHFGMRTDDKLMHAGVSELIGRPYEYDEMLRVPLIIHIPGLGHSEQISITGGQVDILPTLLNLLGLEKDSRAVFLGQDLLNAEEGFVAISFLSMSKGSFIDDNVLFEMSRDGDLSKSRALCLRTKQAVDINPEYDEKVQRALLRYRFSEWMMDNNLLLVPFR